MVLFSSFTIAIFTLSYKNLPKVFTSYSLSLKIAFPIGLSELIVRPCWPTAKSSVLPSFTLLVCSSFKDNLRHKPDLKLKIMHPDEIKKAAINTMVPVVSPK